MQLNIMSNAFLRRRGGELANIYGLRTRIDISETGWVAYQMERNNIYLAVICYRG